MISLTALAKSSTKDKSYKTVFVLKNGEEFEYEKKGYPNFNIQNQVKKEGKAEIDVSEIDKIIITQNDE